MSNYKSYIGAKIIKAKPISKGGEEGYEVIYPDGYVSWSPKETFEQAYSELPEEHIEFLRGE